MRRKFNKCILLITVFSLISILFTSLPISATGTEEATVTDATYDEKLVVHWDFEGNNPLANKAANGDEADITLNGNASVENGVAALSAEGDYLSAAAVTYLKNRTAIFKIKATVIDEESTGFQNIFTLGHSYFQYVTAADSDEDGVYEGICQSRTVAHVSAYGSKYRVSNNAQSTETYVTGEYRYLVCSFSYDSTNDKYVEEYYISNTSCPDNSSSFKLLIKTEVTGAEKTNLNSSHYLSSASGLILGSTATIQCALSYDDIKIYNGAMTIEEAAATITTPKCRGVQIAEGTDEFDLRFVASVETRMVSELGFDVSATYNTVETKDLSGKCKTVYKQLNGNTDKGLEEYLAEDDFNSQYLMALTVKGIPNTVLENGGELLLEVTPYTIVNNQKISLETLLVTVITDADGAIGEDDTDGSQVYDLTATRKVNETEVA